IASYVPLRIITSTSKTNPTTFLEIETFIKSSSNLDCDESLWGNGTAGDVTGAEALGSATVTIPLNSRALSSSFCGLGYYDCLSNWLWHTLNPRKQHWQNDLHGSGPGLQPPLSGQAALPTRSRSLPSARPIPRLS